MNRRHTAFPSRALAGPLAIALALGTGIAFAQAARSTGAGINATRAPSAVRSLPAGTINPVVPPPMSILPGTGTSVPPPGAPLPSGLGATATIPGNLPSPTPFPAGIPSTTIAAPGTSAAGSGTGVPSTVIILPSGSGAVPGVGTASGIGASTGAGAARIPGTGAGAIAGAVPPSMGAGSIAGTTPGVVVIPGTGAVIDLNAAAGTDVRTRTAIMEDTGSGVVNNTAVMGGFGAATLGSPTAAPPTTAVQVLQSFQQADINRDGGVTRAEAQRLPLPQVFEELDVNKDGMLSRGEYEDAFRR